MFGFNFDFSTTDAITNFFSFVKVRSDSFSPAKNVKVGVYNFSEQARAVPGRPSRESKNFSYSAFSVTTPTDSRFANTRIEIQASKMQKNRTANIF